MNEARVRAGRRADAAAPGVSDSGGGPSSPVTDGIVSASWERSSAPPDAAEGDVDAEGSSACASPAPPTSSPRVLTAPMLCWRVSHDGLGGAVSDRISSSGSKNSSSEESSEYMVKRPLLPARSVSASGLTHNEIFWRY